MVHKITEMKEIKVPVNRIRSVTAQLVAASSPSLLVFGYGIAVSFATIVLPDVLNKPEGLSLNDNQASWFGSIPFLAQPFGAFASGPIVDYLGRRKGAFLVNIPHMIAWLLMYFAWNLPSLFVANALLGLGAGLMEAPISSYTGEISEASIRGPLCTAVLLFFSIGMSAIYVLGAIVNWRVAALICLAIPILTMILTLLVVPETPVWLLSQGKEKEALKSLCFLRGWTTPESVREEFDELMEYSKTINCCVICSEENKNSEIQVEKTDDQCEHNKINFVKRFFIKFNIVMLSKESLRPLTFSFLYFMFYVMSGLYPIKPYMVNVCDAMGMADDSKTITIMVGVLTFVATLVIILTVKYLGKRSLGISAMFGTGVCCNILCVYAATYLPENVFSYDPKTYPEFKSMVPLIAFYGLTFFTGVNIVAWILFAEVFPFRSRANSQGIVAAWNYVVTFIGAKTLIDLEKNFRLTGVFAVYAAFSYVGTVYLYFYMPETEGKTLQEIESYYSGKPRIFADDWFINKFKKSNKEK